MKALAEQGEKGLLTARGGDAYRHDHGRIRKRRSPTGSRPRGIRASTGRIPNWSTSRCSSCWLTCAPTASRPSSSPAAASSSCGRGRRRPTAFRPSRWSARPASRKFRLGADGKPALLKTRQGRVHRRRAGQAGRHQPLHRPPPDLRVRQFRRRPADAAMDHRRDRARALPASCTTPTPSANMPTTGNRRSASSTRRWTRRGEGLDRRRHEAGLEDGIRIREIRDANKQGDMLKP